MADYINKIRTTEGDKPVNYEALANKPNSLPNPNKIKFTGSVVAEYDGSSEVTVNIPNGASEEQAAQIQTNTNDISELKNKTSELKGDLINTVEKINLNASNDEKTKRSLDALWKLNQGISYQFETDENRAYQKDVPSGAKLASVKRLGGKTIVWNQMVPNAMIHASTTVSESITEDTWGEQIGVINNLIIGHKYYARAVNDSIYVSPYYGKNAVCFGVPSNPIKSLIQKSIYVLDNNMWSADIPHIYFRLFSGATAGTYESTIQLFDLTLMFGTGNEPETVEEFEAMFPADHYPYDEGILMSAPVNEVVVHGKNLFRPSVSFPIPLAEGFMDVGTVFLEKNVKYYASVKYGNGVYDYQQYSVLYVNNAGYEIHANNNSYFTVDETSEYNVRIYQNGLSPHGAITEVQIEKGTSATPYSTYHKTSHPIPQAILDLDGYGDSVSDDVYNYIDYDRKQYVKRVRKVDLGTLNIEKGSVFYTSINDKRLSYKMLCPKYMVTTNGFNDMPNKSISINTTYRDLLYIRDDDYTDAETFRSAMSGVMLYYELDEPVITDISDILTDNILENLEVETGGTLTFKNSNGDGYRIPVPNTEEYVISLAEVGGVQS